MFTLFHGKFQLLSIYSVKHPADKSEYEEGFLLYYPVHLMKIVRSTSCTEKTQRRSFFDKDKNKTFIANWEDLMKNYKEESEEIVKKAPVGFVMLYTTKVSISSRHGQHIQTNRFQNELLNKEFEN